MMKHASAGAGSLLLWLAMGLGSAVAEDVTQKGAVPLTLTVPHETVLRGEVVRFTVTLHNDSKANLRYIPSPYEAAGKQVFIRVQRADPAAIESCHVDTVAGPLPDPDMRVRNIEVDGKWELVAKEATGVLPPGQSVQWDGSRFDERLFWITLGNPKSIQAQVLIGPGDWVSSKPAAIKVIDKDVKSSPVVFEGSYLFSFRGSQKTEQPIRIHRVNIEGRDYLFSSGRARICEVPKGCTPEFACEPDTAVLTVRFPGTDVTPIRYHYPQMQVLPGQPPGETRKPKP